jgi:hypothetical protein
MMDGTDALLIAMTLSILAGIVIIISKDLNSKTSARWAFVSMPIVWSLALWVPKLLTVLVVVLSGPVAAAFLVYVIYIMIWAFFMRD